MTERNARWLLLAALGASALFLGYCQGSGRVLLSVVAVPIYLALSRAPGRRGKAVLSYLGVIVAYFVTAMVGAMLGAASVGA
jgi:hypothetical protein